MLSASTLLLLLLSILCFALKISSSESNQIYDAGDYIGAAIWISRSFCRIFVFASWSHESFGNYLRSDVKKMIGRAKESFAVFYYFYCDKVREKMWESCGLLLLATLASKCVSLCGSFVLRRCCIWRTIPLVQQVEWSFSLNEAARENLLCDGVSMKERRPVC